MAAVFHIFPVLSDSQEPWRRTINNVLKKAYKYTGWLANHVKEMGRISCKGWQETCVERKHGLDRLGWMICLCCAGEEHS